MLSENHEIILAFIIFFVLIVTVLGTIALRLIKFAESKASYKSDEFRLDIEKQISSLSKELTYSAERFEKVNHLLMDSQKALLDSNKKDSGIQSTGSSDFLEAMGVNPKDTVDPNLVFVLTPFHPEYKETYFAIKQTVEELGFRCSRGDDVFLSSNILQHIIQEIWSSRLIIADITSRNPNVYYELGIAQALGKPVLLIAQTADDLPFDLSVWRVLIYKRIPDLKDGLRKWLAQTLARKTTSK